MNLICETSKQATKKIHKMSQRFHKEITGCHKMSQRCHKEITGCRKGHRMSKGVTHLKSGVEVVVVELECMAGSSPAEAHVSQVAVQAVADAGMGG